MADSKLTIMENIFREMITLIGYEKAFEIVTSMKTEKVSKKKEEPTEEKKKRIPRMSPTLANQLKTELGKVGIKQNEDDKKEFDKIKKEFVTYVDDLTDDDFTAKSLTDHMVDFSKSKVPKTEEKVVKIEEKPKKGKKTKAKEPELDPPSSAADIQNVSLEELQAIEMIATPAGEQKGIYWDADTGRWVQGPDVDGDEDIVETKFKGKNYMVGEKTGRIYEETDDRDVFCGFIGVGQFKDMKMP